jgi:uracil-DNA glycosylase
MMKIEASWHAQLKEELALPYIQDLKKFLAEEKAKGAVVYPPEPLVFHAFLQTPFDKVKVVIMGQDPYHGPGQAHGLSFSVPCGINPPPSLKNIFQELHTDLNVPVPATGCLEGWAQQGVLLLNATLTVRAGEPKSHYGKGWERFTDAVIAKLSEREDPLVFVLWGKSALEKVERILGQKKMPHAVLTAPHPSPYSVHTGFYGSRPFSKINGYLEKWGKAPIHWR